MQNIARIEAGRSREGTNIRAIAEDGSIISRRFIRGATMIGIHRAARQMGATDQTPIRIRESA
jgi:hypothetical protein